MRANCFLYVRQLLVIATLLLFAQTASASNPITVHKDKRLIKSIARLEKTDPQEVHHFFKTYKTRESDIVKENLGFGWAKWSRRISPGDCGVKATFFYHHDSLVGYVIHPEIPDDYKISPKLKLLLKASFPFDSDTIQSFWYNSDSILKPISEYKGSLTAQSVQKKILEYMSPDSGTMYGYHGGYSSGGISPMLQNRKAFLEIKDSLTNDQVILLMYSMNPASRFTAIEHYLKNKDTYKNQEAIDEWIEINFLEIPYIQTMLACFRETMDSRALVNMYANSEK